MTSVYEVQLRQLFATAIEAAQPVNCMPSDLAARPAGRVIVVGAGKASAAMARALEECWPGALSGLVVTRYGYGVACRSIEVVEAAHPVPDDVGLRAAGRMLAMVHGLTRDDLVVGLFSGGGSALLPLPAPGLSLQDKQRISRALLKCGASIAEINCVRRHISAIKGGRLAAACFPARVEALLISDVPGDFPADIASGPMSADSSTCRDAMNVLLRYRIEIPAQVSMALASEANETLKPDDPRFARVRTRIIATSALALAAVTQKAKRMGWEVINLGDHIEGEARTVANDMAEHALHMATERAMSAMPCVLISGGETTVTVRGHGRGGRNVEFLLALALALQGHPQVYALAGDTDGVDGTEEIAGAVIAPDTLRRAAALGLDAAAYLESNDAHSFFEKLGDSIVTGPTYTNVNDFRAILIV